MSSLRQIGQYRIEEHRFSRTGANVYRAVDTVRKRSVTLWMLDRAVFPEAAAMQRFFREVQTAADLVHPHLAWVWETGEDDGLAFVIERYIDGSTLRRRLDESGPLSWSEASSAVEQLAQGLDFTHNRGLVHGRVRPENITLSRELGAVLGGFGDPAPAHPDPAAVEFDLAAARYWAPELWRGERPSPASDRYALACVFAEMLSGQPLFGGETLEATRAAHLGEIILPAVWQPETPLEIEPALERGLAKEPARRYASAAELAAAPDRLAATGALDPDERMRREALRLRRQEAAEQAKRDAEEIARLAALEQARRELEQQAQHPSIELQPEPAPVISAHEPASDSAAAAPIEPDVRSGLAPRGIQPRKSAAVIANSPAPDSSLTSREGVEFGETPSPPTMPAASIPTVARRSRRRRASPAIWFLGVLLLGLLIGLLWTGYSRGWFSGRTSTPTAAPETSTLPAAAATTVPTDQPSPTPAPSITPTFTATSTPTLQPSATSSRTPTRTPTVTSTPTRQTQPTSTNAPRERDGD